MKPNKFSGDRRVVFAIAGIVVAAIVVIVVLAVASYLTGSGKSAAGGSVFTVGRNADGGINVTNDGGIVVADLAQSSESVNSITISYTGGLYGGAYTLNNAGMTNMYGNAVSPPGVSTGRENTIGLERAGESIEILPYTPGKYPDGAARPSHVVVTGIFKNGTTAVLAAADV